MLLRDAETATSFAPPTSITAPLSMKTRGWGPGLRLVVVMASGPGGAPIVTSPDGARIIALRPISIFDRAPPMRSEEPTSDLPSLMRNSYAVFCLKKKKTPHQTRLHNATQTLI